MLTATIPAKHVLTQLVVRAAIILLVLEYSTATHICVHVEMATTIPVCRYVLFAMPAV